MRGSVINAVLRAVRSDRRARHLEPRPVERGAGRACRARRRGSHLSRRRVHDRLGRSRSLGPPLLTLLLSARRAGASAAERPAALPAARGRGRGRRRAAARARRGASPARCSRTGSSRRRSTRSRSRRARTCSRLFVFLVVAALVSWLVDRRQPARPPTRRGRGPRPRRLPRSAGRSWPARRSAAAARRAAPRRVRRRRASRCCARRTDDGWAVEAVGRRAGRRDGPRTRRSAVPLGASEQLVVVAAEPLGRGPGGAPGVRRASCRSRSSGGDCAPTSPPRPVSPRRTSCAPRSSPRSRTTSARRWRRSRRR